MWTKSFNVEVIVICFLSLIPWPGPSVFKISCSRDSARVVRKIVQSKWLPILDKYQVRLPMECPFHPLRDIFGPQQSAKKQHRPSQWTCGLCGKSFFEEKFLDMHFENRHKSNINMAEDAICLADYCDIMRCEVLMAQDSTLSFGDARMMSTDIEIWSEATAYRTALSTSGPRDLAKLPTSEIFIQPLQSSPHITKGKEAESEAIKLTIKKSKQVNCEKNEEELKISKKITMKLKDENSDESEEIPDDDDTEETDSNTTTSCDKHLVDSALPPVDRKQQRLSELQKLKANCRTEDLDKLKIRCEILVRDCIAGLLVDLSEQDFKEMEDELNRAVCWYLTCDRYWEDGPPEPRAFPWGLVFVLVMVLSLGVCFCYYIIWVLFDTDDQSLPSASTQATAHSSPMHSRHHLSIVSSISGGGGVSYSNIQYPTTAVGSGTSSTSIGGSKTQLQQQTGQNVSGSNVVAAAATASGAGASSAGGTGGTAATTYSEDFYPGGDLNELGQSEHYIYVTYPPELKRRLLESCQ